MICGKASRAVAPPGHFYSECYRVCNSREDLPAQSPSLFPILLWLLEIIKRQSSWIFSTQGGNAVVPLITTWLQQSERWQKLQKWMSCHKATTGVISEISFDLQKLRDASVVHFWNIFAFQIGLVWPHSLAVIGGIKALITYFKIPIHPLQDPGIFWQINGATRCLPRDWALNLTPGIPYNMGSPSQFESLGLSVK